MTGVLPAVAGGGLAERVLGTAAALGLPPTVSQLLGPQAPGSRYALAHAVKLPAELPPELASLAGALDGLAGLPVTRWLVWLGRSAPPAPATHLRLALADESSAAGRALLVRVATAAGVPAALLRRRVPAGLVLPLGGGEPLVVTAGLAGGVDVLGGYAPAWHEVQVYGGRPVPEPGLRLAGLVARAHHRQELAAPGGQRPGHRLVLLVRGEAG